MCQFLHWIYSAQLTDKLNTHIQSWSSLLSSERTFSKDSFHFYAHLPNGNSYNAFQRIKLDYHKNNSQQQLNKVRKYSILLSVVGTYEHYATQVTKVETGIWSHRWTCTGPVPTSLHALTSICEQTMITLHVIVHCWRSQKKKKKTGHLQFSAPINWLKIK